MRPHTPGGHAPSFPTYRGNVPACKLDNDKQRTETVQLKGFVFAGTLLAVGLPAAAHASNASVMADTASRYSWNQDTGTPTIGFLAKVLSEADVGKLAQFISDITSGGCTVDNACATIVDDAGGATFGNTDNPTGLQEIEEAIMGELVARPGMQPVVAIPRDTSAAKWNASFPTLASLQAESIIPGWTISNLATLDTFLGNHGSLTVYGPVGFFSSLVNHPNQAVEVGMSVKDPQNPSADLKDTATGADGGIALVFGDTLAFDAVTHASPLYAAAALCGRTRGATRSQITGASAAHFQAVSGTAATVGGNIVGTLGF